MTVAPKMSVEQMQAMIATSPYNEFLGLEITSTNSEEGTLEMTMPFRADLERASDTGQFHGGPIAGLIDAAGDFVLIWVLGHGVPTINFRTDYLRPGTGSSLRAVARIRKAGRTVGVVDIDVVDEQERLVAVGRGCYGTWSG